MATAISNVATLANAVAAANQVNSAAAKTAEPSVRPPSPPKDDTVKLSLAANIMLMHHQGLSPSIIASTLGVSVKQVDTYIPGAAEPAIPATTIAPPSPNPPATTKTASPASLPPASLK